VPPGHAALLRYRRTSVPNSGRTVKSVFHFLAGLFGDRIGVADPPNAKATRPGGLPTRPCSFFRLPYLGQAVCITRFEGQGK
jgi:hypothetical protein